MGLADGWPCVRIHSIGCVLVSIKKVQDELVRAFNIFNPGFDSHRYTKTNITNNIIKIQGGQKNGVVPRNLRG